MTSAKDGPERRTSTRHPIQLDVDCSHGDTYLFARTSNLSEVGLFLVADDPLPTGSSIALRFSPPGAGEAISIRGEVVWVDHGDGDGPAGMGIRFIDPTPEALGRIRQLIRSLAYI